MREQKKNIQSSVDCILCHGSPLDVRIQSAMPRDTNADARSMSFVNISNLHNVGMLSDFVAAEWRSVTTKLH